MSTTLNLGLKSSLLLSTIFSCVVISVTASSFGNYKFFNTVTEKVGDYISPIVEFFPKTKEGLTSLVTKSVAWSQEAGEKAKTYAISLFDKAKKPDTWKNGTQQLFNSASETVKKLDLNSIFDFLKNVESLKEKILKAISDIHGKIIPNLSGIISSLSEIMSALYKLDLESVREILDKVINPLTKEQLKQVIQGLAQKLQTEISNNSEKINQIVSKLQELSSDLTEVSKKLITQIATQINS